MSNIDAYLKNQWLLVRTMIERFGVRNTEGVRDFSLLKIVQTGSGAHPASYLGGAGILSRDKLAGA